MRTLLARSSAPSSVSFAYKNRVTWLHKSEQFIARSGSIKSKIVPIFLCWPHCRKEGSLSVDVLGIFATMLKGGGVEGRIFIY